MQLAGMSMTRVLVAAPTRKDVTYAVPQAQSAITVNYGDVYIADSQLWVIAIAVL